MNSLFGIGGIRSTTVDVPGPPETQIHSADILHDGGRSENSFCKATLDLAKSTRSFSASFGPCYRQTYPWR